MPMKMPFGPSKTLVFLKHLPSGAMTTIGTSAVLFLAVGSIRF